MLRAVLKYNDVPIADAETTMATLREKVEKMPPLVIPGGGLEFKQDDDKDVGDITLIINYGSEDAAQAAVKLFKITEKIEPVSALKLVGFDFK